jgi:hypothetical protein
MGAHLARTPLAGSRTREATSGDWVLLLFIFTHPEIAKLDFAPVVLQADKSVQTVVLDLRDGRWRAGRGIFDVGLAG